MTFRYYHNDRTDRSGEGATTWFAIHNALGRAEANALLDLADLHWSYGSQRLEDDRESVRCAMVETRDGAVIGAIHELRD